MRYTDDCYPANIARCQHIKVNGTLCGSPALKHKRHCFFHHHWQQNRIQLNANQARRSGSPLAFELPILEDANSIQVALMQVMRLLLTGEIEHRTAALMLYALQTASSNLSRTEFKPRPEDVVIDRGAVPDTSLGDHAWYKQEFEDSQNEEDDEEDTDEHNEQGSTEEDGTIQAVALDSTNQTSGCLNHRALCDELASTKQRKPSGHPRLATSATANRPRSTALAAPRPHPETRTKRPQGSEYPLHSRRYSETVAPLPTHRAGAASAPGTAGRAPRTGH